MKNGGVSGSKVSFLRRKIRRWKVIRQGVGGKMEERKQPQSER